MAKADKATTMQRTQEVLRILLAGGEFAEIRQYASGRGWNLSDRQLRRYQERAYNRLAAITKRDQQQLLGRHLMQRRGLYARALKTNDVRTALQVLRDEASLEGLYPAAKTDSKSAGSNHSHINSEASCFTREKRFRLLMAAEQSEDQNQVKLLKQSTPTRCYRMPDTMMPTAMLQVCAMMHLAEQQDSAGMVLVAFWQEQTGDLAPGRWDVAAQCHAYRYKIHADSWQQFTGSLGVDPQKLVDDNYRSSTLELFGKQVYDIAPTTEEITQLLEQEGHSTEQLITVDKSTKQWQQLLNEVLQN